MNKDTQPESRNGKRLPHASASEDQNDTASNVSKTNKAKKRKINAEDDDGNMSSISDEQNISVEKLFDYIIDEEELNKLSGEQLESFNLDGSDETQYFDLNKDVEYSKVRDLLAGRVAWVKWRQNMWPAMIECVSKDKSGCLKVHIRFYEMNQKLGTVFQMTSSKVELFFKTPKHFYFKASSAVNPAKRKEFYVSYTNALRDYITYNYEADLLKSKEKNEPQIHESNSMDNEMANGEAKLTKKAKNTPKEKKNFFVLGKSHSLDEIKKLACQEYSKELLEEFDKRDKDSKCLLQVLKSDECMKFLMAIMKGERKCERHEAYLLADTRNRRRLRCGYVGPLVSDDQLALAKYLCELSEHNFKEKPSNYEYDVLYPEAVIWALMKMEELTYKRAELKCRQGFKLSKEERIKSKCNDIINRQDDYVADEDQCDEKDNIEDDYQDFTMHEDDTSFFAYNIVKDQNLENDAYCKDENLKDTIDDNDQKENCVDVSPVKAETLDDNLNEVVGNSEEQTSDAHDAKEMAESLEVDNEKKDNEEKAESS